jgi:hypothetical protein
MVVLTFCCAAVYVLRALGVRSELMQYEPHLLAPETVIV